jgi:hypothetical protein
MFLQTHASDISCSSLDQPGGALAPTVALPAESEDRNHETPGLPSLDDSLGSRRLDVDHADIGRGWWGFLGDWDRHRDQHLRESGSETLENVQWHVGQARG